MPISSFYNETNLTAIFPESETALEQNSSQLKDERQLRKNYENQLTTLREEIAELKLNNDTLDKVGQFIITTLSRLFRARFPLF